MPLSYPPARAWGYPAPVAPFRRLLLNAATATYDPGSIGAVTAETATSTTFTFATGATKSLPYLGKTYFFPMFDGLGRPVLGTASWCVRGRLTLLDAHAIGNWAILLGVSTLTNLSGASVPSVWGGVVGTSATGPIGRVHIGANGSASNSSAEAATVSNITLTGHYARGSASCGPQSATGASHVGSTSVATVWDGAQLYLGVNFITPGAAFSGAKSFTLEVDVTQEPA